MVLDLDSVSCSGEDTETLGGQSYLIDNRHNKQRAVVVVVVVVVVYVWSGKKLLFIHSLSF